MDSPLEAVLAQIRRDGDTVEVATIQNPPGHAARIVPTAALLDALARLAGPNADGAEVLGRLVDEGCRRGWLMPGTAPATRPPPDGVWLKPDVADVQHGQVWTVRTRGGVVIALAQVDGYHSERGLRFWRAINLDTRRPVQITHVLRGSCPRIGGRRERAKK